MNSLKRVVVGLLFVLVIGGVVWWSLSQQRAKVESREGQASPDSVTGTQP